MFLNKCVGIYDEMINKMTRNNGKDKPFLELYLDFKTEQGSINFKNYLLGDFARACLYLSKTNVNLYRFTYSIPYFDFNDHIFNKKPGEIDKYLFTKYNISNDIIKHIYEILPNYYNIERIDLDTYEL